LSVLDTRFVETVPRISWAQERESRSASAKANVALHVVENYRGMTRLDWECCRVKAAEKVVATVEWSSATYRRSNIEEGEGKSETLIGCSLW